MKIRVMMDKRGVGIVGIYVVTHKKFDWKEIEGYIPIAVGNSLTNDSSCIWLKDNTDQNISGKNSNYCELTAQYWIWKNDKTSEIKGLCHYRRYFSENIWMNHKKQILNQQQIVQYLKTHDILLPYPEASIRGTLNKYCDFGFEQDVRITRDVIFELYPEYIECFDNVFYGTTSELFNMLITSAHLFDEYSKWLFDILFEVEHRVDLTGYSVQQKRIFGYISERLLSVWVNYHNYRVKYLPVFNTEEKNSMKETFYSVLKKIKLYYFLKNRLFILRNRSLISDKEQKKKSRDAG